MSTPTQNKTEMNGRTRTESGSESIASKKSPTSPLARMDSTESAAKPYRPRVDSGGSASKPYRPRVDSGGSMSKSYRPRVDSGGAASRGVKSPAIARIQRQASRDSTGMGRSDSVTSRHRRPSLSLGHSDSIPFHLNAPSPEEVDPSEDDIPFIDDGESKVAFSIDDDSHVDDVANIVDNKPTNVKVRRRKVPWWTSKRLLLSFTCFVGFFFLYSLRVNLSTAIVCMTREPTEVIVNANNTANATINYIKSTSGNLTNGSQVIEADEPIVEKIKVCRELKEDEQGGEFCWDKKLRGLILGAFFWGYTIMQIPSGYISDRFGPRLSVSLGMIPVAVLTIICPFLARGSPYLLLVGRIFIGFGEAMMYPGMQSLWAKWSPPHERSRLVGFAFGGSQLGNALTFPFAGLLCEFGFDGGWPSVFYITGGLCFLWCCVYVFFARNSPGEMKSVTPIECKYIEQSLGVYGQTVEEKQAQRKKDKPWLKIFTSGPVWAILLANACGNYGAYMLLTQMPTYMKEVLKFDIKSNGAFSMIPYLVFWVFIILGGQIADVIITKNILSIEWTRKLCCALGTVVPGIFLILTGYMDENHKVGAVVLLSLSMGFCGFQFSSFFINHGDIAPKYAGTVFGFTNTGASVPGIIAPYIVGALTPNKTREEWLLTFYIAAAVYCAGAIIYAILAKGEVQDWAKEDTDHEGEPAEQFPLHGISEEHDEEDEKPEENNVLMANDVKKTV